MTYEEANAAIAPGLYRHFKGNGRIYGAADCKQKILPQISGSECRDHGICFP